jgi:single-strand DNA-binding protein
MIQASIHGRIGSDPTRTITASGKDMTRLSVAVDCSGWNAEDAETVWISVLAFGKVAESLALAKRGESLSAQGKLTRGRYTGKDGVERESWTLTADAVLTLRSARPGQRKAATNQSSRRERWEQQGDDLAF